MKNTDILKLDIKLLAIFCAVAKEGSISKAAQYLNVSQPLVSHALDRLRIAFGDPLFVRAGRGIVPTERTLALAPEITAIIDQLEKLAAPHPQALNQITTRFCMAAFDYERRLIAPGVLTAMLKEAPQASLYVTPSNKDFVDNLRTQEFHLAITPISPPSLTDIHSAPLFEDDSRCFFDPNILSAEEVQQNFSKLPHASVRFSPTGIALDTRVLKEHRIEQNIKLEVSSFEALPPLMRDTKLIAILPSRLAGELFADFESVPPPCPFPIVSFKMVWHAATHHNPAHQWFRDKVRKSVSKSLLPLVADL